MKQIRYHYLIYLLVVINHDVDKSILNEIESTINKLVLMNYMPEQKFKEQIKLKKENEKLQLQNEKLQQKIYENQMKEQNKINNKQQQEYKLPNTNNLKPVIQNIQQTQVKKGIRTLE